MPRYEAKPNDFAQGFDDYLSRIGDVGLLTEADEKALSQAVAAGEDDARARLIEANLRLVVRIARDFRGRGLPMDDLVGEGNLGLIKAAERFDAAFGVRFGTYAAHWIRQAVRQALTNTAPTIRVPVHTHKIMAEWRRAEAALGRETGREPGFDEVADRLGLTPMQRVMAARALQAGRIRLEGEVVDEGPGWGLADAADGGEGAADGLERREELAAAVGRLGRLDARERFVVESRFGLGGAERLTLKEVAGRLGCTREWVRKLEVRALARLADDEAGPARRPGRRRSPTSG